MRGIFLLTLLFFCGHSSGSPLRKPKERNKAKAALPFCDVGIIGAGISGLYMAFELLKNDESTKVCVFEKDKTPGGRLHDFRFKETPNIDVGLGAWRNDKKQNIMLDLVDELGVKLTEWTFENPTLYESRDVKANNEETIKTGYPTLLADPVFGNMTSSELLNYGYRPEHLANIDDYATANTYFSNLITPEGARYMFGLTGHIGSFTDFISPQGFLEWMKVSSKYSSEYFRPIGGMSIFIDILSAKVKEMGGRIFTSSEVRGLKRKGRSYIIRSQYLRVRCKKVIIATPPLGLRRIAGNVAKQLQNAAEFNSIEPMTAVKAHLSTPMPGGKTSKWQAHKLKMDRNTYL